MAHVRQAGAKCYDCYSNDVVRPIMQWVDPLTSDGDEDEGAVIVVGDLCSHQSACADQTLH